MMLRLQGQVAVYPVVALQVQSSPQLFGEVAHQPQAQRRGLLRIEFRGPANTVIPHADLDGQVAAAG